MRHNERVAIFLAKPSAFHTVHEISRFIADFSAERLASIPEAFASCHPSFLGLSKIPCRAQIHQKIMGLKRSVYDLPEACATLL